MNIIPALRAWCFEEITDAEAIREIAIGQSYDKAVLVANKTMGTRRDFEPLEIHGRVIVWTNTPVRRWWLSPNGWTPKRGKGMVW